jgi:hypothetical protein
MLCVVMPLTSKLFFSLLTVKILSISKLNVVILTVVAPFFLTNYKKKEYFPTLLISSLGRRYKRF